MNYRFRNYNTALTYKYDGRHCTFKTASDFPAELDRLFNIDENVMRSMTIKLDMKAIERNNAAKKAPVVEAEVVEVAETTDAE